MSAKIFFFYIIPMIFMFSLAVLSYFKPDVAKAVGIINMGCLIVVLLLSFSPLMNIVISIIFLYDLTKNSYLVDKITKLWDNITPEHLK